MLPLVLPSVPDLASFWPGSGLAPSVTLAAAVAALAAALAWRHRQLRQEALSGASARLVWCSPSTPGISERRRQLAQQVADIIAGCSSLRQPGYVPPPFAAGTWSNLALFLVKQELDLRLTSRHQYRRQCLTCPDGGVVSVDWADDDLTRGLPDTAPVVIFLHTITGSTNGSLHYMRGAAARGWRSCVFTRRGHGSEPLKTGLFNLMGDVDDTRLQVAAVRETYPRAYIGMAGISAGSGLLVTYLGKEGEDTPVQAACSLCPAYDISQAFTGLFTNYYWVDRHLLTSVKQHFIERNRELLCRVNAEAVAACWEARSCQEFIDQHYPFAGFGSREEYYADSNPMEHIDTIMRPLLVVNADDDIVCLKENIREDVVLATGGALLLRTKRGSHIAYNEGWLGQGNYLVRVSMDFLETARKLHQGEGGCE